MLFSKTSTETIPSKNPKNPKNNPETCYVNEYKTALYYIIRMRRQICNNLLEIFPSEKVAQHRTLAIGKHRVKRNVRVECIILLPFYVTVKIYNCYPTKDKG